MSSFVVIKLCVKIKFAGKSEYEFTINYNIVQKAMRILKIDKVIPSEALMKVCTENSACTRRCFGRRASR